MNFFILSINDNCDALLLVQSSLCISLLRIIPVIPGNNRLRLSKEIERLNKIYNSLEDNSSLKNYLKKNCLHFFSPLKGFTNVPVEKLNSLSLIEDENTVKLSKSFSIAKLMFHLI